MRKVVTVLIFFTMCSISYGQSLNDKNLIGKWSVTKVTSVADNLNLSASEMEGITAIKKSLHNSIFDFKENGQFLIEFVKKDSINTPLSKLNGKNWKFNFRDEFIVIVDKEETQIMTFGVDKWTPLLDVKFSLFRGMITLHMNKE